MYLPGPISLPPGLSGYLETLRVSPRFGDCWRSHFIQGTALAGWTGAGTGAIVHTSSSHDSQHPGILALTTSAGALSWSLIHRGASSLVAGVEALLVCDMLVRFPLVSDAGDSFQARFGWGDAIGGGDHANGIYWETTVGASPVWNTKTAAASARTTTAQGGSIAANTWYRLGINALAIGGTLSAVFFLDGVQQGTVHTANMPTGANKFGPLCGINKLAGTPTRSFLLDYYEHLVYMVSPSGAGI